MAKKLHKLMSRLHKWVGLIVGIQLLLWTLSGFIMSWYNIDTVRGSHLRATPSHIVVNTNSYDLTKVQDFISNSQRPIKSLKVEALHGDPVVKVAYMDGDQEIRDPQTLHNLSPLSEEYIRTIAMKRYQGDSQVLKAELLEQTGIEYRGSLPVWKVDFSDKDKSSFYFHPQNGRLVSVRTDLWRLYDFFWMFHIMDYDSRDDFNHPLLYLMSLSTVFFMLTGFFLIYFRFTKRDFKWFFRTG